MEATRRGVEVLLEPVEVGQDLVGGGAALLLLLAEVDDLAVAARDCETMQSTNRTTTSRMSGWSVDSVESP